MKCRRCNTENLDNNRFCRNCGSPLSENLTIPELFPEFNFRPTTVFKIPGESKWMFAIVLVSLIIAFVCYSIIAIIMLFFKIKILFDVSLDYSEKVFAISSVPLLLFPLYIIMRYCCRRFGKRNIQKIADYVQTTPEQAGYYIVVKDSKFGLYDYKKMQLSIPCEYTYLSSKGDGLYLVEKDGSSFIVDKFNNRMK